MRTGEIFARGSCRALKWMALFGVVFALGAGSAVAQVTIKPPKTVSEGGRAMIPVEAKVSIPAGAAAATVSVDTAVAPVGEADLTAAHTAAGVTQGDANDSDSEPVDVTLTIPANPSAAAIKRTVAGTIVWQTRPDRDAEDEAWTLTFTVDPGDVIGQDAGATVLAGPAAASAITITDTDEQTFVLEVAPNQTPKEAGTVDVTLKAMPAPVDRTYDVALAVNQTGYTVAPSSFLLSSITADGTGPMTELVVTAPANDKNRDEDTVTLSALKAGTVDNLADPVEIEVADIHGLPDGEMITAEAFMVDEDGKKTKDEAMSVMEGDDPVVVTVTVDRGKTGYPSGEVLEVALMPVDSGQGLDFRLEMSKVEIAAGVDEQTADVKLWALKDEDVIADEVLMFNLVAMGKDAKDNGGGESMGMFSIMITDDTDPMVSVKDGAYDAIKEALGAPPMLYPGMSGELMTGDLFDYNADMVSVAYGGSSDSGAVSVSTSGYTVTVMGVEPGEAKVTVTATATPMGDSLLTNQTVSNVAQLTFPVTVGLLDLEITLSGPEDMNIAEGMSAMVTATANRPVTEDTMVELIQTEGTASPADFMAEPIMIAAGMMEGTTMLMAVADDMMEDMEMLTLEGRVGAMKTNSVSFYLWDAAVPALPLIAQLLLAAFLAIGGYRRYLRR